MLINTNYRIGSYIDLCHCPCSPYYGSNCFNNCFDNNYLSPCYPCSPCCECGRNNCINPCSFYFLAGYLISKNINQ